MGIMAGRSWLIGMSAVLAVAAAAACSGESGGPIKQSPTPVPSVPVPPPPSPTPTSTETQASATVGSEGGEVTTTEGTGVEIPSGALPNNVNVSVVEAPAQPPPEAVQAVATPYVFGPSGLQFAQPVTVILAFDPSKLPAGTDASSIVVYTAPDGTTEYEPLPTVVRDATHVAAQTTHFSVFLPAVPDEPVSFDGGADAATSGDGCSTVLCGSYGPGACGMRLRSADGLRRVQEWRRRRHWRRRRERR
jgi:hypothetical protein